MKTTCKVGFPFAAAQSLLFGRLPLFCHRTKHGNSAERGDLPCKQQRLIVSAPTFCARRHGNGNKCIHSVELLQKRRGLLRERCGKIAFPAFEAQNEPLARSLMQKAGAHHVGNGAALFTVGTDPIFRNATSAYRTAPINIEKPRTARRADMFAAEYFPPAQIAGEVVRPIIRADALRKPCKELHALLPKKAGAKIAPAS